MGPTENIDETPRPEVRDEFTPVVIMTTLDMFDGTLHIMFPLGRISTTNTGDDFCLVWIVDKQEFWVTFLWENPEKVRKMASPGTSQVMSIGVLTVLFTGEPRLCPIDDKHFFVRDALYIDNKWHVTARKGKDIVEVKEP